MMFFFSKHRTNVDASTHMCTLMQIYHHGVSFSSQNMRTWMLIYIYIRVHISINLTHAKEKTLTFVFKHLSSFLNCTYDVFFETWDKHGC